MNKITIFLRESSAARFLIPVGLILIIFGAITFIINKNNQDYLQIEATVVDVKEEEDFVTDGDGNHTRIVFSATVTYTVDGKDYTQTLDNVSKQNVGDKMVIYYNPSDPSQITQTKSLLLPICIMIAGAVALIGGVVSAKNAINRHNEMKEQERSWTNE